MLCNGRRVYLLSDEAYNQIGYLALPPTMPDRGPLREAITALQLAMGWIYPDALLQHALPRLEQFTAALVDQDVFVLPGTLFETPGYFRISLTASEEVIQRALPVLAAAIQHAAGGVEQT